MIRCPIDECDAGPWPDTYAGMGVAESACCTCTTRTGTCAGES